MKTFVLGILALLTFHQATVAGETPATIMGKPYDDLMSLGRAEKSEPSIEAGPPGSSLSARSFPGTSDVYLRVKNTGNFNPKSVTIFTYLKQTESRNGAIIEWAGFDGEPFGTHFWIWENTLFVNLVHDHGKMLGFHHVPVEPNKWNFVGMSYDYTTGVLLMWVKEKLLVRNVGQFVLDTVGDVYIGVRAKDHSSYPFRGLMTAVILWPHAVSPSQFETFKKDVEQSIIFPPPTTPRITTTVPTTTQPVEDVCSLPKKPGPCKGSFTKFYFDQATGKCESFTYGGCQGNGNNFETKADCEKQCKKGWKSGKANSFRDKGCDDYGS